MQTAYAHTGVEFLLANGFAGGFFHPLSGLDHLITMLGIGVWAGQLSVFDKKQVVKLPLTFVLGLIVGAIVGVMGIRFSFVESGIAFSGLALGFLILMQSKLSHIVLPRSIFAIVSVFGFSLFHGHAHGTEMVAHHSVVEYFFGFITASCVLHLLGIVFSLKVRPLFQAAVGLGMIVFFLVVI
ncbi:MAG: HupE/UreJ family protein [Bacteriovoracia bacterium]